MIAVLLRQLRCRIALLARGVVVRALVPQRVRLEERVRRGGER